MLAIRSVAAFDQRGWRKDGLGLDIVQRIVRKHQGSIQVQSRPGDMRFHILLPLSGTKDIPRTQKA